MGIADLVKNKLPFLPNWFTKILLRLNCFGGLVYGRTYQKIKAQISDSDPEKILLEMVNYAIEKVPYYRSKYAGVSITSIQDFQTKIGFIDKEEVMAHWDEFVADGIDKESCVTGTTGGTSGRPLKLLTPKNRYSWELAYMHHQWEKSGWHYDVRGVIRNHDLRGRDYVINPIMREVIFDPHKMSKTYVRKICSILKRYKVQYVTAYPSNVYQFGKLSEEVHEDISFIKAFLCGSEGITDCQKSFFERRGMKILSWYGHSEKLILGSNDLTTEEITIEPGYGYCELIDRERGVPVTERGAIGEMVGTTYFNKAFPLIRYRTGDYATLERNGDSLVLGRIYGRWDKSLVYKIDGTTTSLTVMNMHGVFNEHIDGIQFEQEKKGFIKVRVIKNNLYSEEDHDFITTYLGKAMGGLQYVEILYVDTLVIQPNGKFLPLISKIN